MRRGKLIVFEGPDGVGKTTLAHRLTKVLASSGCSYGYVAFPGRAEGSLGRLVYRLHHEPEELGIKSITPTALQALHVAAHLDGLESIILPALEQGSNLLLDRFWWSMDVYGETQGVSKALLSALHRLELTGWQDVLPDIVFLVERHQPFTPEALPTWNRLVSAYISLAEQESKRYPVVRLKNDSPLEDVLESIVSTLARHKLLA